MSENQGYVIAANPGTGRGNAFFAWVQSQKRAVSHLFLEGFRGK